MLARRVEEDCRLDGFPPVLHSFGRDAAVMGSNRNYDETREG
jgi:hypothetical protein